MLLSDLVTLYLCFAETYYRKPAGRPTRQAANLRSAFRHWLTCDMLVNMLTLEHVTRWRESLVSRGISRSTINQYVGWFRSMIRWAARRGLIPEDLVVHVSLIEPLKLSRTPAVERPRVRAVPWHNVAATLTHLPDAAARAVQVQWYTGMRAAEVLSMRRDDLHQVGDVLVYLPREHKTEHHGHTRAIGIPEFLLSLLGTTRWCFEHRRHAPYTTNAYAQAIRRACSKAGTKWTSHQLRHAAATDAAYLLGLDAARQLMGHAAVAMTERYIDRDIIQAAKISTLLLDAGRRLSDM